VLFAAVAAWLLAGCSSQLNTGNVKPVDVHASMTKYSEPVGSDYIIQAGDTIEVKFFNNKELNEVVTVRPDGKISLQLIDEVSAAGKTPSELDGMLTEKYAEEFRSPIISVIMRTFTDQKVFVGGEVKKQGIIDFRNGMTILQAVYQAEGFGEDALPSEAIVIRKDAENRPIPVRVDITNVVEKDIGANYRLQPQDIVYVPKTAIAHVNKFTRDYIRGMLMFNGFGASLDYQIDRVE